MDSTEETRLRRSSLAERLASVGTLAEELAHEIRNPLNCALLQVAVLQRRLELPDCVPATVQPVAQLVEQALRRLERLVGDFVDVLQPDSMNQTAFAPGDQRPAAVTPVSAEADATSSKK